ncbi:MAG: hypothetical protein OEV76_07870, partial [Anaerolineae bacterium]|nr:hypothetical protein [Anaerolineae bacterium]
VGLRWLRELWRVPWGVLLVVVAGTSALPLLDFYTFERYVGEDYRPVVERVQALARPEDVIVAVHPWQLGYFQAYYLGEKPFLYLTPKQATDVTSEQWAMDHQLMERDLDHLLTAHRFLWFPAHQTLGRIVESDVESYLLASYYPILSEWYSDSTRLSCFASAEQLQMVGTRTDFGGKVSLDGYGISSAPVEAGWDAVLLDLHWRIDGDLPDRHQMVLRLVDDEGREWAVEDTEPRRGLLPFHEQPVGGRILDHQSLLIPAGTPPGLYRLELGLYRLGTGECLNVRDQEGVPQGVYKRLGVVEVVVPASPPPEESLSVQYLAASDSASGLRFLGFSLGAGTFQPGQILDLTLFWRAMRDVREDYSVSLRLEDAAGRSWASAEGPLASEAYPTSSWRSGQLARGMHSMTVPADIPSGQYGLVMSLHNTADGSPVPWRRWLVNWGYERPLGTVSVQGRARQTNPPASIAYPLAIRLGDAIQLLGYDLDKLDVAAGESVHLTLYWHALAEVDGSYTVFNHLIDDNGRIWGQKDGVPAAGLVPTSGWIAGEYVVDEYDLLVDQDTSPGEYLIETGMYDPQTMLRLPVFDAQGATAGDRVLLEATPIRVR